MNNLTVRVLFALMSAPIIFFLIWFNSASRWAMLVALVAVGAWEWARMVSCKVSGPSMRFLSPLAATIFMVAWIVLPHFAPSLLLASALVLTIYLVMGFARVPIEHLFPWIALHCSGPLYLGLWGGLLLTLMGPGHGFAASAPFILVMFAMWVCDSFAYFCGRLFGKHKMAPEISPKKTWEGAVGGTLFTMGLLVWWGPCVFHTGLWANLILGLVLSAAGQVGDLFESALKRWAGFKDASQVFPGHGGVLDRMDSLFLAGPLAAVVLAVVRAI